MQRLTGKFKAKDDNGREYAIHVYTDFIPAGNFEDPHAEVAGLKHLQLSTGESLNRIGKGEYEIRFTGKVLRSTDPAAP
jgi:hypothetical protein